MDWLDAYLDNLADGRNVVYPPDKNTWTPVKPNRQQQSMIQDAVAFDQQQQMRMIQEARADLEAHGMSQEDVQAGIGADPGSPAVQTTSIPAAAFPVSISIEGVNLYGNTGNAINSVSLEGFFDEFYNTNAPYNETEMAGLLRSGVPPYQGTLPFRLYANFIPNASGGYDYIYLGYLLTDLLGYYNASASPGRWFIGNGYSFVGDNQGYYSNYGYYTALQSNSTLPSTNIANWTRVPGYYDQSGNITSITFNY
jgi:hypothetical protein